MRIIHLILGKANPDRANGVNKVVHQLSQAQAKLGHRVAIWGITPNPEEETNLAERGLPTFSFEAKKLPFQIDGALRDKLQQEPADTYFHIHGGFVTEFYTVTRILKKQGNKYCISSHGTYNRLAMERSPLKKKYYFKFFESQILNDAEVVHLVGDSELVHCNKMHNTSNNWFFQNGMIPAEKEDISTNKEAPIFGYCGRLNIEAKGLDLLLKGFEIYKTEMGGTGKLQLLGKGPDEAELKKQSAGYKSGKDISFEGPIFGEEKDAYFENFDCFIHSSRYEGMPTAVLEAIGMGLPVIVSEATNLGRFVQKYQCGLVLHENSPQEIAKALKKIEDLKMQETIVEYRRNAFRMIKEEFTWSFIAEKMVEKYAA